MHEGREAFVALREQIVDLTTPDGEPVSVKMSGNVEGVTVHFSLDGALAVAAVLEHAAKAERNG